MHCVNYKQKNFDFKKMNLTHQILLQFLIAFHLLLLKLCLFAFGGDAFLLVIIELCVFLRLQHLGLPLVVLGFQLSGPTDLLKEGSTLFGVLHRDGLHGTLEIRK